MIIGAHSILQSTNPEADRAFVREVLELPSVDVGGGWLIFGLPPAELAFHPGSPDGGAEFYLMCEDVEAFIAEMQTHAISCEPVQDQGWGLLSELTLPGGGKLKFYQPRHARPDPVGFAQPKRKTPAKRTAKKPAAKAAKKPAKKATKATKSPAKRKAKRR